MNQPTQKSTRETAAQLADPARLHRRLTAVSLAGSALLVGVASVIPPPNSGEAEELYRIAGESAGRLTAEAVLLTASSVLLVVGILGAARLVWGRGRYLARAAALLGVMGALGHMAYATYSLVTIRIVEAAPSRDAAVATLESVDASVAIGLLVFPMILAYALSVLLLPIALHRARITPSWVVAIAVAAVAVEVTVPGSSPLSALKYVLGAVAATAIAVRIARLRDDEWRRPGAIAG